jgi:glycosyltransferase involved in cell wall biosynthesis
MLPRGPRARPLIAFLDFPDVFEDFYSHYGVDQHSFATHWMDTAVHGWLDLVQHEIGDVIWYVFSIEPALVEAQHERIGCRVKFLSSSWLHRVMWRAFYLPRAAWRWRWAYRAYATMASYVALASFRFLRVLRQDGPDVFLVASYASGRFDVLLALARLLGIPLLALHTGGTPDGYLGGFVRRWTLRHADWIFPSGTGEFKMLVERYGIAPDRLAVIRPEVDITVFRPRDRIEACRAAGLDPRRRYVLFVGRLDDSVKRVSSIIEAFSVRMAEYVDADLLVVGDGRDRSSLRAQAMRVAPNRVHFLGWISGAEEKAQVYNSAECLVLASWREASPAVINEAFACGTPVLASNVGGIGDLVVDGQTGWLFPAGDDEALASRISDVLSRPDVVASMRPRVRELAETQLSGVRIAAVLKKGFASVGVS